MNTEYLLEIEHMTKTLKREKTGSTPETSFTIHNIDFKIQPGYIVGLIGCNGAGKSTLLNTIMGIYRPDAGNIKVAGYDRVTDSVLAKKKIAFVTDECLFPLDLSPKNIGAMFGPRYDGFDKQKFEKMCSRFAVPYKKTLRQMSKGTVVKAQLAFCLSHDALLYVFDEPTAGLDPVFRKELMDYFCEIVADGTKSILISTHLTDELDKIADYILYMDKGYQKLYMEKEELQNSYYLIRGTEKQIQYYGRYIVAKKAGEHASEALISADCLEFPVPVQVQRPSIEDIMVYFVEGGK